MRRSSFLELRKKWRPSLRARICRYTLECQQVPPAFIEPLQKAFSPFIQNGVLWRHGVFRRALNRSIVRREIDKGVVTVTVEFHAETLWLIPAGMAIGFMLWVLWNW